MVSTAPSAANAIVECDRVWLTLAGGAGPVNILHDVSLSVFPGETISVMGPSGAGKTSLLMILAGLERPSQGSVRLAGQDISRMDESQLARLRGARVGIVFQAFHLIASMTALENVALPLELAGRADAFEQARESLATVGLADRVAHYPAQLSGGEQQRVALARAFAPRPQLILADEPTGNLDEETGAHVMDILFSLREAAGTTLVLVTHDHEIASRCSRRLRMIHGALEQDVREQREGGFVSEEAHSAGSSASTGVSR